MSPEIETDPMENLKRQQRAKLGSVPPPVITVEARTVAPPAPVVEVVEQPEPVLETAAAAPPVIDGRKVEKQARAAVTKEINRQTKAAAGAAPDAFKNPVAAGRENMATLVPDGTHLEMWKRDPDSLRMTYIGDFWERDLRGHRTIHQFLSKVLYPKHHAKDWEVVFVTDDGKERKPYPYSVDPAGEGTSMDANSGLVMKLLDKLDRLGQPQPQEDPVDRIKKVLETFGPADEQDSMTKMMMMRYMFEPPKTAVDPEVAALRAEVQRLLAVPPSPPPPPPPVSDPNALTIRDLMAWQEKADAKLVAMFKELNVNTEKQIASVKAEIKPAPERSLETVLAEQRTLLAFAKEATKKDESETGTVGEFFGAVAGLIKTMREQEAAKTAQSQAQVPQLPPAPPVPMPLVFPDGFAAEVEKINIAADNPARIEATLHAWGLLVASKLPPWEVAHAHLVNLCREKKTADVRELLGDVLNEMAKKGWLKREAQDTTFAAFDAKIDDVMAMLGKAGA